MNQTFEWENRTRLVHEVAKVLRERIYAGHFAPGDSLKQVHISNELKVSRTPVREAFRMLEQEGLVAATNGGGVQVTSIDIPDLLDGYAMREVVDGLAAKVAAQRGNEASIRQLLDIIDLQNAAMDPWAPPEYTRMNVAFHAAILNLASNKFLSRELPLISMTSQVFKPLSLLDRDRAVQAIAEHREIATAIMSNDGDLAESLARKHIRSTIESLKRLSIAKRHDGSGQEATGTSPQF